MVSLKPGVTPLPIILGYFVIVTIIIIILLLKAKPKFNAIDLAIIGVGGALVAIFDHIIGDAIFLPSGIYPIINPPVWFRIFVFFITVGVVRKVGSGITTMAVYDIVSDLLHFGFTGEPLWLLEDILTYGAIIDIAIFITRGKIFGIGEKRDQLLLAILEGGIIGFIFSFIHPFFTYGFFAPLIFGFIPNQARIMYLFITYIPGTTFVGAISAIIANRVSKVIR